MKIYGSYINASVSGKYVLIKHAVNVADIVIIDDMMRIYLN